MRYGFKTQIRPNIQIFDAQSRNLSGNLTRNDIIVLTSKEQNLKFFIIAFVMKYSLFFKVIFHRLIVGHFLKRAKIFHFHFFLLFISLSNFFISFHMKFPLGKFNSIWKLDVDLPLLY